MCGVAGFLNLDGAPADPSVVRDMSQAIAHRGRDGHGHCAVGPVALGHRRLAIIDLTDAAAQPMYGEDRSIVLSCNGEIFNYRELRSDLVNAGHRFVSNSDSEVLVHGYEEWGDGIVDRLNGMFAFAIWDERRRRLLLARDRFGVKPLYWLARANRLVFASEIKAILRHPVARRDVCHAALNEYFSFQNILSDRTLFEGVRLLPPGHLMVAAEDSSIQMRQYWDYPVGADPLDLSPGMATDELHDLFVQAVTRQLVSDAPVGAYLSGGVDSGSIASIAGRHLPRLHTFTAGFDLSSASGLELGFDERAAAELLSNTVKSEHYEVVLHAGDMEHVLPELIWHLEDLRVGQCYPNYYVARLASRFVKVVLSGAGGDELFGGYPWRYYRGLDAGGRAPYLEQYYEFWQRLVRDDDKSRLFRGSTAAKIGELSTFDQFRAVFDGFPGPLATRDDALNASLYFELKTFLPGLLLVEDKLSMAHSLETRVPFLDNDLVDWGVRLPASHKLRNLHSAPEVDENAAGKLRRFELETGDGKVVLREAMRRIIPQEVASRTKQGFSAPDASWFRGESIQYIDRLLRQRDARIYDLLEPTFVASKLDDHIAGRQNNRLLIWSLLSLEWWLRTFMTHDVPMESSPSTQPHGVLQ